MSSVNTEHTFFRTDDTHDDNENDDDNVYSTDMRRICEIFIYFMLGWKVFDLKF